MRKVLASIDFGSDSFKIIVVEVFRNRYHVLSAINYKSAGIKKGLIVNIDLASESLAKALSSIEERIGLKITKSIVNIPANYANFEVGYGQVTIENANHTINSIDIINCISKSVPKQLPINMELVTVIPIEFIIDNKDKVKEPLRLTGLELAVKSVVVTTPKKNIYSVLSVMEKVKVNVTDIILGSIGDYYTFADEQTNKVNGVVINVGHEITTVSVFVKGVITNTEVLEIGNANIDNDIAFIYKINHSDAAFIKESLALGHSRNAYAEEFEEVTDKFGNKIKINQYEISEIVNSRIQEILNLAKKQINLLTKKEISYIIITGGITEIKDFKYVVEDIFGKNATIGSINTIGVRSGIYSSALGMIKYFSNKLIIRGKNYSIFEEDEIDKISDKNKINVTNNSILDKVFGYFFDN